MNGVRKFDLGYTGDPDLQPIRSFENKTMVRMLHRISVFLNTMVGWLFVSLLIN